MPSKGAAARGRHIATLERLAHTAFTDAAVGALLDDLEPHAERLPAAHPDSALIRVTRRDYERDVRVPAEFAAALEEHAAASYAAWVKARPANDFAAVRPLLERTLDLSRRLAGYTPNAEHVADPLIDRQDPGMTASQVSALFAELPCAARPAASADRRGSRRRQLTSSASTSPSTPSAPSRAAWSTSWDSTLTAAASTTPRIRS